MNRSPLRSPVSIVSSARKFKPLSLAVVAAPMLALSLSGCGSSSPTTDATASATNAAGVQTTTSQSNDPSMPDPNKVKINGDTSTGNAGAGNNNGPNPQIGTDTGASNTGSGTGTGTGAGSTSSNGTQTLTGTLHKTDYDGVLKIQGIADPNPGPKYASDNNPYYILVLDSPITFTAYHPGSQGVPYTSTAKVFALSSADTTGSLSTSDAELDPYDGQHIAVIINKNRCGWPSDTGLPLGQPRCAMVKVK